MSDTAQCEICGLESPTHMMELGYAGYYCIENSQCRPPMGPKQRVVATLDTWLLDRLEWHADQATNTCADADVTGPVLHALVAAARRDMAMESPVYLLGNVEVLGERVEETLANGTRVTTIKLSEGERARRDVGPVEMIRELWGAGPGTTPLSESDEPSRPQKSEVSDEWPTGTR